MNHSYEQVLIEDRAQWRAWLDANHGTSPGIWLVTWKKASGRPLLAYDAIVEEALAYGWVDSRPRSIDEHRPRRLLTPASRPALDCTAAMGEPLHDRQVRPGTQDQRPSDRIT